MKILVGYDGTNAAKEALNLAKVHAKVFDGKVDVVTSMEKGTENQREDIEQAERNLRASYPRLRLVGRFSGYFAKPAEKQVLTAIKKASPSFLLVGSGLPGRDLWILRKNRELNPGVCVWVGDCFEVFSGKRQVSRLAAEGSSVISVFWFWLIVLFARIFKR